MRAVSCAASDAALGTDPAFIDDGVDGDAGAADVVIAGAAVGCDTGAVAVGLAEALAGTVDGAFCAAGTEVGLPAFAFCVVGA
jgi:hypothetical protein